MTSRYVWIFILAVLLTALAWERGYGQDGPVEFRLKLTRGEVLYYAVSVTAEFTPPPRTEQLRWREAVRVLEIQGDGTALVEANREDFRNPDGSPLNDIDGPYTFKVRPDGKVMEVLSGRPQPWSGSDDFPFPLPPRLLVSGETWTRPNTVTLGWATFSAPINGTLERVERAGNERIARLRIRFEGRGTGRPTGLPPALQVEERVTFRRVTDVAWSVERGRVVQEARDELRDYQNTITVGNQSNTTSATSKETIRRQALSAETVVVPSVATGFLIAPGKGIGASTLDLTVEELTKRFDVPWTRNESLFRVPSVRWWPNELVGYVDPTDENRLLGLHIGDRRYRTEKGIGFGSSQGAVLFAHGMSPASANMSIAKIGTVRMMIYDDQGIAFLVIGEKARDATDQVPPVGTVLSTVVFVPGAAGKIFPVP